MNKVFTFINDIPPSNNQFLGKSGNHWKYHRMKKEWLEKVTEALVDKIPKKPFERSLVELHYIFPDRRRRDCDNYSGKFILDALVQNKVILDDSFYNIALKLSAEVVKRKKQTNITVTDLSDLTDTFGNRKLDGIKKLDGIGKHDQLEVFNTP